MQQGLAQESEMCIRDSLCRYQVANGYMGRVGLINSGGESHGESDLHDAVVTAVVNLSLIHI